jgi:hypothetical protein
MASCPKCGGNVIREWINKKKHRRAGVCGGCGKTVDLGRIEQTETSQEDGSKKTAGTETPAAKTGSTKPARTPRRASGQPTRSGPAAKRGVDTQKQSGGSVPKVTSADPIGDFFRKYIW